MPGRCRKILKYRKEALFIVEGGKFCTPCVYSYHLPCTKFGTISHHWNAQVFLGGRPVDHLIHVWDVKVYYTYHTWSMYLWSLPSIVTVGDVFSSHSSFNCSLLKSSLTISFHIIFGQTATACLTHTFQSFILTVSYKQLTSSIDSFSLFTLAHWNTAIYCLATPTIAKMKSHTERQWVSMV